MPIKLSEITESLPNPRDEVYVIAEVGSNFGGDKDRAMAFIERCAEAGADAVKFQSWTTENFQSPHDPESGKPNAAFPILKKYELPPHWCPDLKALCDEKAVDFLSTPFDLEQARMLKGVGVSAIKVASGDLTYIPLLEEIGTYGIPILLSTGMANLAEVECALDALGPARDRTILLHAVGAYPPDEKDANLRVIPSLGAAFGRPVGLSDHFTHTTTVVAGVALGARVIEKHVTFSREDGHPDSPFALEMDEFTAMVKQIRSLQAGLGDGRRVCSGSEKAGLIGGRRSLYWARELPSGAVVSETDFSCLRPAMGDYAPIDLRTLVGTRLHRAVQKGDIVKRQHFSDG